jgi:hypothetical protein
MQRPERRRLVGRYGFIWEDNRNEFYVNRSGWFELD